MIPDPAHLSDLSTSSASPPLRANSVQEVVAAVKAARQGGYSLYPVSTGRNWGYGGSSPVHKSSRVLDLRGMNRILNEHQISPGFPVAVLQPGVTQGQLRLFLDEHHPGLTFNVTGSGCDTSILGASLDRGVGYFGPRRDDIYGLEIVTGLGEVITTGFRRLGEDSPLAHSHPHGCGPILDGLFSQGNLGIVTSACFRLQPRRELHAAMTLSLRAPHLLGTFLDRMAILKRNGTLPGVAHIANRRRTHSSLRYGVVDYLTRFCGLAPAAAREMGGESIDALSNSEWTALVAVYGTARQVRAAFAEARRQLGDLAHIRRVTTALLDRAYPILHALRRLPWCRARAAAIHALRPLHGLTEGVPTDAPIENLLWQFGDLGRIAPADFESSRCGVLFVSPALPLDGNTVVECLAALEKVANAHKQSLFVTLNIEGDTTVVGVINLLYDKTNPADTRNAFACADALLGRMRALGLHPYRARTDMMSALIAPEEPYWQYVHGLKQVFDPDDVIAPGRYNFTLRPEE